MEYRTRPFLGALGDALMYGAENIPKIQTQNALLAQRYKEYLEEKEARERTAAYQAMNLGLESGRLEETKRHNLALENQPAKITPESPLNESQVKAKYLDALLSRMSPEEQLKILLKEKTTGIDTEKSNIPTGLKTATANSYLSSRMGENFTMPPITSGTLDTLRSLGENLQYPQTQPGLFRRNLPKTFLGGYIQNNISGERDITPEEAIEELRRRGYKL